MTKKYPPPALLGNLNNSHLVQFIRPPTISHERLYLDISILIFRSSVKLAHQQNGFTSLSECTWRNKL